MMPNARFALYGNEPLDACRLAVPPECTFAFTHLTYEFNKLEV
jgi:hypothetical protein